MQGGNRYHLPAITNRARRIAITRWRETPHDRRDVRHLCLNPFPRASRERCATPLGPPPFGLELQNDDAPVALATIPIQLGGAARPRSGYQLGDQREKRPLFQWLDEVRRA